MSDPVTRERWRRARLLRNLYSPEQRAAEEESLAARIAEMIAEGKVEICPGYHSLPDPYEGFGVPQHPAPELSTYVRN